MSYPNSIRTNLKLIVLLLTSMLLSSCGSGGGDRAGLLTYIATGTVSGDIVQDVNINLSGKATATATTDKNGIYSFAGLINGSYFVLPSKIGFEFTPNSASITVNGTNVTIPDFTVNKSANPYYLTGAVTGDVKDKVLITLDDKSKKITYTDVKGEYSFTGLGNGTYTATPSLTGYSFNPVSTQATIKDSNARFSNLTSTRVPTTFSILGTLSGAIQASIKINLAGVVTKTTISDGSGNFNFADLDNGSYTVTPTKTGFIFIPASATVNLIGANITLPVFTVIGRLNDTGITQSQCFAAGSDAFVPCSNPSAATTLNNAQDGMVGRDVNALDPIPSDGKLGFSFSKVCNNGETAGNQNCSINAGLGNNPTDWACTQDNVTGLMWEVKTSSNRGNTYTNYDDPKALQVYGGGIPTLDRAPSQSEINAITNSIGFINFVNLQGLCGQKDWRIPTLEELQSIIDYGVGDQNYSGPSTDSSWFPNTPAGGYWSSSPDMRAATYAWKVFFNSPNRGNFTFNYRNEINGVRLVRSAQ